MYFNKLLQNKKLQKNYNSLKNIFIFKIIRKKIKNGNKRNKLLL